MEKIVIGELEIWARPLGYAINGLIYKLDELEKQVNTLSQKVSELRSWERCKQERVG